MADRRREAEPAVYPPAIPYDSDSDSDSSSLPLLLLAEYDSDSASVAPLGKSVPSINRCTHSSNPASNANASGVWPSCVWRGWSHNSGGESVAQSRKYHPPAGLTLFTVSRLAPARMSCDMHLTAPCLAAIASGVSPCCVYQQGEPSSSCQAASACALFLTRFTASLFAPALSRTRTQRWWPLAAASAKAVRWAWEP